MTMFEPFKNPPGGGDDGDCDCPPEQKTSKALIFALAILPHVLPVIVSQIGDAIAQFFERRRERVAEAKQEIKDALKEAKEEAKEAKEALKKAESGSSPAEDKPSDN